MSEDFQSQVPATPVHDGGRVPPGCLVSNRRWKGSQFHKAARAQVQVIFEDDLGVADFYPTSEMAVVYVSESDLVAGTAYRRKLAKLRKVEKLKGVVVVEKTPMTDQYYLDLQKFVVLELGMVILPISNQTEAAGLLARMVLDEQKPHPNPFLRRRKPQSIDSSLLVTMQTIPKLGAVKAKRLLQKFGSIKNITEASVEELASVIGTANARHVKNFLTTKVTSKR
ncbi:Fanconi anemia core complex-associated protein 24-like [Diadema antillarum]|uniref:Fanconi anemia core complex-associated protein 24-like n=1 Tax=Diadema antillarum TaxID=105358 RepID=UPI003A87007D